MGHRCLELLAKRFVVNAGVKLRRIEPLVSQKLSQRVNRHTLVGDPLSGPPLVDLTSVPSGDFLSLYLREMDQEPLLSRQEEMRLSRAVEAGLAAAERLANGDVTGGDAKLLHKTRRHLVSFLFKSQ